VNNLESENLVKKNNEYANFEFSLDFHGQKT